MKKGFALAAIIVLTIFAAAQNRSFENTLEQKVASLPKDCLYIKSSVFKVKTKEPGREMTVRTTPIEEVPLSVEKDILPFTKSEIPLCKETFSSKEQILGEIARSDVKMAVSTLRYATVETLIEPAEISPQATMVQVVAAPPREEKTIQEKDITKDVLLLQRIWKKNPSKCITLARSIIERGDHISKEDLAEAWYRKGRAHRIMGQPLSAMKAHKMAAEILPTSASYLNGYAWILSTVKPSKYRNHELALEKAREAVALSQRKSANYLDTLGRTLFVLGHQEEAFETQKEAVALNPGRQSFRRRLKKYEASLIVAD